MKTGIELIAEERQRQIEKEGWTPEHNDEHNDQSLLAAAVCYAETTLMGEGRTIYNWPWDEREFKPSNDVRNLVKAGALIAAEIDRINRAAVKKEA